jgi:hypothetical protein
VNVAAATLDLTVGAALVIAGRQWSVESFEPQFGQVLLRREDGERMRSTVRALLNDSACRAVPATTPGAAPGVQLATLAI